MPVDAVPPVQETEVSDVAHDVIKDVERRWNAAASTWDIDAFAAVYTGDALMFGGRADHSVGNEGVHAYFASYVGVLTSAEVTLTLQHIRQLGPETILTQGYGEFDFVLANGQRSHATLRTTWVIIKKAGEWKVLQHHFSAMPEAPPIPR